MARRLTEEQTTKSLIKWLIRNGWTIISFDFPQSGTGRCLHPNDTDSKTDGTWIPDIIAHKGKTIVFFENKDRFVYKDFEKIEKLKHTTCYSKAIIEITHSFPVEQYYYGIGFPYNIKDLEKAAQSLDKIDFLLLPLDKDNISLEYNPYHIF